MSVHLQELQLDSGQELLVLGYLRTYIEPLLQLAIPDLVVHACLSFSQNGDWFDCASDGYVIGGLRTLTKRRSAWRTCAFGNRKIPSDAGGVYSWSFKVICSQTSIYIGITTDHDNVDEDLWRNQNGTTYAVSTTGSKVHNKKRFLYCDAFQRDDLIKMQLDLNDMQLSYFINEVPAGIAFSDLPKESNLRYQMAVTMLKVFSSLRLTNHTQSRYGEKK